MYLGGSHFDQFVFLVYRKFTKTVVCVMLLPRLVPDASATRTLAMLDSVGGGQEQVDLGPVYVYSIVSQPECNDCNRSRAQTPLLTPLITHLGVRLTRGGKPMKSSACPK
jgi:hypothetical protein